MDSWDADAVSRVKAPNEPARVQNRRTLKRIDNGVAAVLVVLIIGVTIFFAGSGALAGPEVLPPQFLPTQVLSPATVPPAYDLCSEHLSYSADGNASPLICTSGLPWSQMRMPLEINVLAWKFFAANKPRVMALGPNASAQVVETAICADLRNSTIAIETSAVDMAYIYYRWSYLRFGRIKITALTTGGCP
jgi:hypothetical protein